MNSHSSSNQTTYEINFQEGEEHFVSLLQLEKLDQLIKDSDVILDPFEESLDVALSEAFSEKVAPQEPILFIQNYTLTAVRSTLYFI